MSTSCGACGSYGIRLSSVDLPEMQGIIDRLAALPVELEVEDIDNIDTTDQAKAIQAEVIALFESNGIKVPEGASLQYSGTDDDRPARCETEPEEWILGFGLFTDPNRYPPIDNSFDDLAAWHTWVWLG